MAEVSCISGMGSVVLLSLAAPLGFVTQEIFPLPCPQGGHRTRLRVLFFMPKTEALLVAHVCMIPAAAPFLLRIPRPQADIPPAAPGARPLSQGRALEAVSGKRACRWPAWAPSPCHSVSGT